MGMSTGRLRRFFLRISIVALFVPLEQVPLHGEQKSKCDCSQIAKVCNNWRHWNEKDMLPVRQVRRILYYACTPPPDPWAQLGASENENTPNLCAVEEKGSPEQVCMNVYTSRQCHLALQEAIADEPENLAMLERIIPLVDSVDHCWLVRKTAKIEAQEWKNRRVANSNSKASINRAPSSDEKPLKSR